MTPGPASCPQFFKRAVAQVAEDRARGFVGILRQLALHFRVNVACNHEQIGIAIVIQIDDAGAPADVTGIDCEARRSGEVVEVSLAVIVIKAVGVLGEVGFEQIEMTVEIIVANADAHSGLLHAVIAEGYAAEHAFFPKRSVMVVHEEQTWGGIARHKDVCPAVFVEIGSDYGHPVALGCAGDPGLLADVA